MTTPAASATPISLEDLNAVAALQTRTDRKYLVPLSELTLIENADPHLRVLTIDGETDFAYASQYLDTPALDAFRLHAHGRGYRFKVRTRTYSTGEQFLEVKTKNGRGETVKDRLPLADATRQSLARFAPSTVRMRTGHELASLEPTLDVTYHRTTYLLPASDSRVTVDTGLTWHDIESAQAITLPGWAIIETKTAGRPCELDRRLWRAGYRPSRMSKYTCGLALLNEDLELPTNRWHRTLNRLASNAVEVTAAA